MRLRLLVSAAGITAVSLLPSVAVTAAPSSPSAATAALTAPTAPRTPSVERGHGQITVTWTVPASTGGSPITSYRVKVTPVGRTVTVAAPANSATVIGLADGTAVNATVVAINAVGTSPGAAAGSAIPTPPITAWPALSETDDVPQAIAAAPDGTTYLARASSILQLGDDGTATPLDVGTVHPTALTVAPDGALLWLEQTQDGHGYVVRRFHDGSVTTVAGGGDPEQGWLPPTGTLLATDALLVSPLAIAVSPVDGSVFLVDFLCGVVERFTIGGTIAFVAGDATPTSCMGHGTSDGDGGPAVDAHLDGSQGIAIDDDGAVYVSETWSNKVRRFTVGGTITTAAGDGTETIDGGADLLATATGVPGPSRLLWISGRGLIVNSGGRSRLLVGERLRRISDDAFDVALFNSIYGPTGIIGANDNTLSLAWDGSTLWGVFVVHDDATSNWHREVRSAGPWLPASTPSEHPGFGSWADLVTLHFRAIVNRSPTASERTIWVDHLTNGTQIRGELDDFLRRTKENTTNVNPVVRLYRAFLGRAPDANGLRYWIAKKRSVAPAKTWSVTQLANQFAASSEFHRKYGSLSNQAFVTRIYTDVLGRPADASGVTFWTKQLDTKRRTRATVMVGFSESSEYQRKQAANTDVAVAYLDLVGRMPTVEETAAWTTAAAGGASSIELLDQLVKIAPGLL